MVYQITNASAHGDTFPNKIWVLAEMTHISIMSHVPSLQNKLHYSVCLPFKVIVKVEGVKRRQFHAPRRDLPCIQRRHYPIPSIPHYAIHSWEYPLHRGLPLGRALQVLVQDSRFMAYDYFFTFCLIVITIHP